MRVKEIMSRKLEYLNVSDALSLADDLMVIRRIRHLPIMDNGELVGIVSDRDLLQAGLAMAMGFSKRTEERFLSTVLVGEVMTSDVITIDQNADVKKAARIMSSRNIGCLPVLAGVKLVGLLSESDILRVIAGG
ncbi:MAG: CBS domain-containing protein [Nitrospinaceae bacterium]|jgi:CBS domain-containing protein|nr:CBS domain-containing protein [Nitrospinaceae bacterium]MBT5949104.1 CBS domain-containing protein [Nitrospinaceae bacterium]